MRRKEGSRAHGEKEPKSGKKEATGPGTYCKKTKVTLQGMTKITPRARTKARWKPRT